MIDGHYGTDWWAKTKEAHNKGMDHIYLYGIQFLKIQHRKFHEHNLHTIPIYHTQYISNPFRFQYDLCLHIWLKYFHILKEEIKILRKQAKIDPKADALADELMNTQTLYGITRSDFLFMAGDLRWPTSFLDNGARHGLFIRDPWSERRVAAISDEKIKNTISFGGGGQGKTHISSCVALMIFDHYIFTQRGARCMLSTVNKDKLNSVGWSYICRLNSSTEKEISLYAGKAKIGGEHTLKRPGNKDPAGVFKGLLIGQQMNSQNIVDKLTGSHGHPFICYILDEMQSTPDPPIMAAPNYTMHAKDYRILGAGNYGENNDTLAVNIKPDIGWDKVDETTGRWISTMQNGSKAIVLHFNNNLSPGMDAEGHAKYPHLPNKKMLEDKYPTAGMRDIAKNIAYRRFWVGWRVSETGSNKVIYESLVHENGANSPLQLSRVTHKFFSFDSAPAEIDRNLMIRFEEGICSQTNQRVFGPVYPHALKKATESTKYYRESSLEIKSICDKNGIKSGSGVVDWTGRPAHAEILGELGFMVHKLIYNKGVPDGKRIDPHTKRRHLAIPVDTILDFKNDIPAGRIYAHHIAENNISLGAWALREYVKCGRFRGLTPEFLRLLNSGRDMGEEFYNRKFYLKNSSAYGARFHLASKDEFKQEFGFSPDALDCLFEAAWYMLVVRKLPLTSVESDANFSEVDTSKEIEEHSNLWNQDGLEEIYEL